MKSSEIQKNFERHLEPYRASKLSKAEYCKVNKLCYHQFIYWLRKNTKKTSVLVPVKIKPPVQHVVEYADQFPRVLCALDFGQNGCLKVYDIQAMASIVERLV